MKVVADIYAFPGFEFKTIPSWPVALTNLKKKLSLLYYLPIVRVGWERK